MSIMSSYKKYFYQLKVLLEQQSERDRVLIVFVAIMLILGLWYVLFYHPIDRARSDAIQKGIKVQKTTDDLIAKKSIIDSVLSSPNTPGLLARHQELTNKIKEIDQQLARYNERFISKKDLSKLLHDVLKQTMGLTLEDFSTMTQMSTPVVQQTVVEKNNTVESTSVPTPESLAAMSPTYYRLVLKGSYFQVMNYLHHVEQMRWNLYWDKLDYQVTTYPDARVVVEFYTLKPESERPVSTSGGKQ